MNHRLKKITATLVITALLTAPSISLPGDLNTEMQSMFNSLGTLGNVSSPGAFRGQAMNLYTGGSLFMREPSKNYALVRAQLPSLKAGCGGIDLFGGSFSFINKAQFVALLQNIGANAVGYAFKLALQSISPDIDKLLTELQDQINKINTMNINSCEAAQSLVNGVVGQYDNSIMSGCENISQYLGSVTDRADARVSCATNAPAVVKAAANSADPNLSNASFIQGNVVWDALNRVGGGISQQEKEFIMSIVGTVVLYPPDDTGAGAAPAYFAPTLVGLRDLLLGKADSATSGYVDVDVYQCDEPVQCMNPSKISVSVQPFTTQVTQRLQTISNNIATRTAQGSDDIGFINNTSEPVFKMLAIGNAVPGSNTAESLIATYKDVIALDYAETFLNRAIKQALSAFSQSLKRSEVEAKYIDNIRASATDALKLIAVEKQTAYGKVRSVSSMAQDLQNLERQLWSAMPPAVKSMLDFSANVARH